MGVLERNVEVRKDLAFSHQGNDFIDRRIRVHVVRAYPNAEFAEFLKQDLNVGLNGSAADEIQLVFHILTVGCRILCNHKQFFDAALDEIRSLTDYRANRTRNQRAPQRRNNTERAVMVTALCDLEVGVMLWRQQYTACRH